MTINNYIEQILAVYILTAFNFCTTVDEQQIDDLIHTIRKDGTWPGKVLLDFLNKMDKT